MQAQTRIRVRSRDRDPGADALEQFVLDNPQVKWNRDTKSGQITLARPGDMLRFVETFYGPDAARDYRDSRLFEYVSAGMPMAEVARRMDRSPATVYRWRQELQERMFERWKSMDPWGIHVKFMEESQVATQWCFLEASRAGGDRLGAARSLAMVHRNIMNHLRHGGFYDVFNVKGGKGIEGMERAQRIREAMQDVFGQEALDASSGLPVSVERDERDDPDIALGWGDGED